jgi:anthranilate phosphoribosyltransferase
MILDTLIADLAASRHLSDEQAQAAVEQIIDESVPAALKADFLCHLALKGETVDEIAAFARALREKAIQPPLDAAWRNTHEILDVCGTGGDRLNTFNISTTVAIICAAAGIPVAKHGNRAITSQAGSADVLEALGIATNLPPAEAARSLRERNFAFFFAPSYHPAFKHIGPARKLCADRGQRTIFNFLGPLLNPARPGAQLVGVPRPELCEPLAHVLQSLGARRGMVVTGKVPGADGVMHHLDELSTLGENTVAEFYQERGFTSSTLDPDHFPLQPSALADLAGGDRDTNAEIVTRILRGDERGPKRDAVLLNAAAGLFVANRARTLNEGWTLAAELIDNGQAAKKLAELAS